MYKVGGGKYIGIIKLNVTLIINIAIFGSYFLVMKCNCFFAHSKSCSWV